MTIQKFIRILFSLALLFLAALTLFCAGEELFDAAWGAGDWLGGFLPKWGVAFFAYALASLAGWGALALGLFRPERVAPAWGVAVNVRERLGIVRGPIVLLVAIVPAWMFQYSYLGLVFVSPSMRLTVWTLSALLCGFLLTRGARPLSWPALLTGILLSGGAILIAFPLQDVSAFPFSLGWSEGNRLYDYSIMFGRARYVYPADEPLRPFLDLGRQFTGGLAFLYPGLTIWQARLWQGLMGILPYFALGLAVFRKKDSPWRLWLLAGLWGYAFLRQGPIHTPLVFVALIVALVWRKSYWTSIPLLALSAFAAALSRSTWVFAPAMWVGMLIFVDASVENGRLTWATWKRAIILVSAALAGGLAYWLRNFILAAGTGEFGPHALSRQPLLWYRLLPHEALGPGVIGLLLIAILPLVVTLLYLTWKKNSLASDNASNNTKAQSHEDTKEKNFVSSRLGDFVLSSDKPYWPLDLWQRLAILAPLLAFLVVGLIASAKIGGGGDLHNLDMFLIGLLFLAGLAWDRLGPAWITNNALPLAMKVVIVLLLATPVYFPLVNMRPLLGVDEFPRLILLTEAESPRDLGLLPLPEDTDLALKDIRRRVDNALAQGEVLFMDQRQLLTFGFIPNVPLIPDYEKKYLMDSAMADSIPVFAPFYADLQSHRFALIVSEPLRLPIKDQSLGFGEENNAWVKWVSAAVLCYYEPDKTYPDFRVQLLVPRVTPIECDLPILEN
jgi:hypothetical protein